MSGRHRFDKAFNSFAGRKSNEPLRFAGLLGILTNGEYTVEIPSRPGYVWVRLRNSLNELIQAYNGVVSPVYDLPVMIERDPFTPSQYRIIGRDTGRYGSNWGTGSAYLASHGNSHSFNRETEGAGDVVWVHSQQFMPFLVYPSGSFGGMGVMLYQGMYYYNDEFRHAGGTGTSDLSAHKPTSGDAKMVLITLNRVSGNIEITAGSEFSSSITGTSQIIQHIPSMPTGTNIPLAAIRLLSGTSSILWANIYDVRDYFYR